MSNDSKSDIKAELEDRQERPLLDWGKPLTEPELDVLRRLFRLTPNPRPSSRPRGNTTTGSARAISSEGSEIDEDEEVRASAKHKFPLAPLNQPSYLSRRSGWRRGRLAAGSLWRVGDSQEESPGSIGQGGR